jgi:hypothetical protein
MEQNNNCDNSNTAETQNDIKQCDVLIIQPFAIGMESARREILIYLNVITATKPDIKYNSLPIIGDYESYKKVSELDILIHYAKQMQKANTIIYADEWQLDNICRTLHSVMLNYCDLNNKEVLYLADIKGTAVKELILSMDKATKGLNSLFEQFGSAEEIARAFGNIMRNMGKEK